MFKFNRAAGNQSLSTADNALLTFPNSDWLLGFIVRFDGVTGGDVTQYLFSSGNFAAAGSLNVVFYGAGVSGTTLQGHVAVYANTLSNANAPALLSSQQFSSGEYYFFIERSGGVVNLYTCPILTSRPIDGSALVLQATTSGGTSAAISAIVRELNGSGFMYGSRVDNTVDRKCDQSMSRMLRIDRALTQLEKARLAYGEEIADLGYAPLTYVRASSITDITDRSQNALPYTVAGSPTTSTEPTFGYVPGQTPQPDPEAITIDNSKQRNFLQSGGSSAVAPFSGALSGTQATSIEVQLISATGVAGGFQTLQAVSITTTNYSGTLVVPDGGPYTWVVRKKSGTTVLATSSNSTAKFWVGDIIAAAGSSSAEYLFTSKSGSGYSISQSTAVLSADTLVWSDMSSIGAATQMASDLSLKAGKPIGWIDAGVAGTTLNTWNDATSNHRKKLASAIAFVGGKIKILYFTGGSNDAANGIITSSSAHTANMQKFIDDQRSFLGQPSLPVIWPGSNRRPPLNSVQANRLRMGENGIGDYPNVLHVQTIDAEIDADNVHPSSGPLGYLLIGKRAMFYGGRFVYDGADPKLLRGPKQISSEFTGDTVYHNLQQRSGTDVSPATSATGFAVTDASGTPVVLSTARVNASRYMVKYDRALVAPVVATYGAGADPNMSAPVYDNSTQPLPMTVETDMIAQEVTVTPPADTTAPAYPSGAVISITNITNNGATITSPTATDNVATIGYEYSINGGNTYSNLGNTRTATLTGMPAGTQYSVMFRAYDAAGNRSQPLTGSFTTLAATPNPDPQPVSFMRSKQRTINIKAAPGKFTQDVDFWKLEGPKKPLGSIDPNSTIDITFNWTEVLADIQDTISSVQFDIVGLTNKGSATQGAFATIFVANAAANPSITCRITTASTPPRVEDRTVYLTVEQQ